MDTYSGQAWLWDGDGRDSSPRLATRFFPLHPAATLSITLATCVFRLHPVAILKVATDIFRFHPVAIIIKIQNHKMNVGL